MKYSASQYPCGGHFSFREPCELWECVYSSVWAVNWVWHEKGGGLALFEFESGNLFLDVCVFCLHVFMCILCMQCLWRPEESSGFPWTGVTDGCELPCGYWESNLVLCNSSSALKSWAISSPVKAEIYSLPTKDVLNSFSWLE